MTDDRPPTCDWANLLHAYGAAEDVPGLLDQLSPDSKNGVWNELWSRLCHQGSVYSASFATLPFLATAMRRWKPVERAHGLALAGAIVASDDVEGPRDEFMADKGPVLAELRTLGTETLAASDLPELDFIYVAQAVLALEGEAFWGRHLDRLVDGEFDGACTSCGEETLVEIGQYGCFTSAGEWLNRPGVERHPIVPASDQSLSGTGRWLWERSVAAGHASVVNWIQHLFGSATCPSCSTTVPVEAMIRAATG